MSLDGISGGAPADADVVDAIPGDDVSAEIGWEHAAVENEGSIDVAGDGALADAASAVDDSQADAAGDGAVAVDTGTGEADADGVATPFCATLSSQPLFCDDFDERPLPGLWSSLRQVGGTLRLDPAAFVSPPNSLLAQDLPLQSGQRLDTALRVHFPLSSPSTTIIWDFLIQPVSPDPTGGAVTVIAAMDFTDVAGNRYSVQFTLVQQGGALALRLEEQSGFVDGGTSYAAHPLPDPLTMTGWTDIHVIVTRTAATTASVHVSFNGVTEIDTPVAMTVNGTTLQITIGSSFESEPSNGWKIRYDDVTLDVRP